MDYNRKCSVGKNTGRGSQGAWRQDELIGGNSNSDMTHTSYRKISSLCIYTRCSLCRLIRFLSTWLRGAVFFSASGAALSQEVPTIK
jgi:hypothetical protein